MAVSKIKGEIQVITVPQCWWVAFEEVQSLGTFRRGSHSTKLSWLSHRCWAKCHAGYNPLFDSTLDPFAIFHGSCQSQDHSAVRR